VQGVGDDPPAGCGKPKAFSTRFSPMVVDWMTHSSSGVAPTRAAKVWMTVSSLRLTL
jgi:hypothetical protein